jgi:hypothetical protein
MRRDSKHLSCCFTSNTSSPLKVNCEARGALLEDWLEGWLRSRRGVNIFTQLLQGGVVDTVLPTLFILILLWVERCFDYAQHDIRTLRASAFSAVKKSSCASCPEGEWRSQRDHPSGVSWFKRKARLCYFLNDCLGI